MSPPTAFLPRLASGLLCAGLAAVAAAQGTPQPGKHSHGSHQHGAHEHGAARLEISLDGPRLTLRFESPLDNLVGFESAPRNDRQRTAVRRMAERFHRPLELFEPTRDAGCTTTAVTLDSDVIPADLLAAPGSASAASAGTAASGKPAGGDEGHADLDVEIALRCERPDALKGVQARLFDAFPKLQRIDAAAVTSKGQRAARLTPKRRTLSW